MFRNNNPVLNNPAFGPSQTWDDVDGGEPAAPGSRRPAPVKHMTMSGAIGKCAFLIALCIATAGVGWYFGMQGGSSAMLALAIGGLGGFGLVLATVFVPKIAPFTAPPHAIAEGVIVGAISAIYAQQFGTTDADGNLLSLNQGLILNAVLVTFGIFGGLLVAYGTGLVRPGRLFYNIVTVGTIGVALYAVIAIAASFLLGNYSLISVYDPNNGGLISVAFSLFVVGLASANLVIDFDQIHLGVRNKAPKYMEWFGGMALLVTLVWLYINVLRLLAKLQQD